MLQLQAKARFSLAKEHSEEIGCLSLHFNMPNVARPLQAALLCDTNSQYLPFLNIVALLSFWLSFGGSSQVILLF